MKAEINIDVLQKLFEKRTSHKLIFEALEIFKISKKSWKQQILLYIISSIVSLFVGMSTKTVSVIVDSAQVILDIVLALFSIVFTGYALFQALINNELLIRLLCNTSKNDKGEDEKSKLQETNESFVKCMLLNILAIIISLLVRIIVSCVPEDFLVFNTMFYNNISAALFISVYFYFIITIIWEVKSFVFNVFQLFNAYAGTRVLGLFEDNLKNE